MVYLDVFVLGWFIIADEDVPVAGNPLDVSGLDVLAESQVYKTGYKTCYSLLNLHKLIPLERLL